MKPPTSRRARWGMIAAAVLIGSGVALVLARRPLTRAAVGTALEMAGASEVELSVFKASPWEVILDEVGFRYRTHTFSAARVSIEREHWWSPSLGSIRIERAVVPVSIDGSDVDPLSWARYEGGTSRIAAGAVPADRISLDGTLLVRAAVLEEQPLTVEFAARQLDGGSWSGELELRGAGLAASAAGVYRADADRLEFSIREVRLELDAWDQFIQRMVLLPGGSWDLGGIVTGNASGTVDKAGLSASGAVRLRDGSAENRIRKFRASGLEAEFEFTDFASLRSAPGVVRADALEIGGFTLTNLDSQLEISSAERILVERVRFDALGGTISTEPFKLFPLQYQLEAVVLADGLEIEQVLALAPDVPAEARGEVGGQLAIRLDDGGLRFGTGWLELKPGSAAEVEFKAAGLLTRGADPRSTAYPVLQKIEAGLLDLRLSKLRLDVYPPNRPPGRSAQLHLSGEPVDPEVHAPVTLNLNVNGPIEKLINLGVGGRLEVKP